MVKQKGSGWHGESRRHSLARKGIKTSQNVKPIFIQVGSKIEGGYDFDVKDYDKLETTRFGFKIKLKEYNPKKLNPKDLKLIKGHRTFKTKEGTDYYGFTNERSLEEIKKHKETLIKRHLGSKNVKKDSTIFGSAEKEITIPKQVIPKHKVKKRIVWDNWNDGWDFEDGEYR